MVRQYGLGYVFVDQSASLLSKVAFANSYATIALSQKLHSDVQTISGAMNLTDEQKQALNTLPIGSSVIRLADEHPESFLVKIPLSAVREGSVSDKAVKNRMARYYTDTGSNRAEYSDRKVVPPIPLSDNKTNNKTTNKNGSTPK
jgi:DNA helicase HerA-like ATPase